MKKSSTSEAAQSRLPLAGKRPLISSMVSQGDRRRKRMLKKGMKMN